jgi:hypothetical protein
MGFAVSAAVKAGRAMRGLKPLHCIRLASLAAVEKNFIPLKIIDYAAGSCAAKKRPGKDLPECSDRSAEFHRHHQ